MGWTVLTVQAQKLLVRLPTIPDNPKNNATSPAFPILQPECNERIPLFGIK
jgi:hypothetical protein